MCFNKKVIAGLALVTIGVVVLAPNLLSRALPLLILAACPLSMIFMMRSMGRMGSMQSGSDQKLGDAAAQRELEEEINRLRAEINLRDAGRA